MLLATILHGVGINCMLYCMCTDTNDAATYSSHGTCLVKTFEESREFLTLKQQLDAQLNTALNEPQGKTPQYATNFLWQVRVFYFQSTIIYNTCMYDTVWCIGN